MIMLLTYLKVGGENEWGLGGSMAGMEAGGEVRLGVMMMSSEGARDTDHERSLEAMVKL